MFKTITKLFSKQKKEEKVSAITIYTDETGEIFVDLQIKDYSDISIDHLSGLLSMYNPAAFVEVNNVIRNQCKNSGEEDLHEKIFTKFLEKVGTSFFLPEGKKETNEPCIKPDQMI